MRHLTEQEAFRHLMTHLNMYNVAMADYYKLFGQDDLPNEAVAALSHDAARVADIAGQIKRHYRDQGEDASEAVWESIESQFRGSSSSHGEYIATLKGVGL